MRKAFAAGARPTVCALLGCALASCGAPNAPATYEDVAGSLGIDRRNVCGDEPKVHIVSSLGGGAAWLDADLDGDLDLYLTNGSRLGGFPSGEEPLPALYRNDGGRFVEIARAAGLAVPGWWQGCAVGDADGDGDPDLFVTAYGRDALFRNRGDGTFEEAASLASVAGASWSSSVSFLDADLDGDLDLYVARYIAFDPENLPEGGRPCPWRGQEVFCGPRGFPGERDLYYRNDGDGRFTERLAEAGMDPGVALNGLGTLAFDFDDDGDPDLYVANDRCRNLLFVNRGDGRFEEAGVYLGVAYGAGGEEHAGMGIDAGDPDLDGDLDLFVTNFEVESNDYYRNDAGAFLEAGTEVGLDRPGVLYVGWGTRFLDYDLDGDEDLFAAYGHVYPQADRVQGYAYRNLPHLYRNDGGRFEVVGSEGGPGLAIRKSYRGAAFGDFDDDLDPDVLLVAIDEKPVLLRNGVAGPRAVAFSLRGTRSNRDGYGARVAIRAAGKRQVRECRADGSILSANDPRAHFGLGEARTVEEVEVRWPSGRVDRAERLAAGRFYVVVEGGGFRAVERGRPVR